MSRTLRIDVRSTRSDQGRIPSTWTSTKGHETDFMPAPKFKAIVLASREGRNTKACMTPKLLDNLTSRIVGSMNSWCSAFSLSHWFVGQHSTIRQSLCPRNGPGGVVRFRRQMHIRRKSLVAQNRSRYVSAHVGLMEGGWLKSADSCMEKCASESNSLMPLTLGPNSCSPCSPD